MMNGMTIDWETADRITVLSLKDQLQYLEKEISDHVNEGQWMHPEDYHNSMTRTIPALKHLIQYYGG
jgi:hypothetical protein